MRIWSAFVLVLLAGCGSVELPETAYYRLRLPPSAGGAALEGGRLGLHEIRVAPDLATDRLMVAHGPVRMRAYHYHQWSASLDRLISDALLTGLSRSGCFEDVFADGFSRDVDYLLDARVQAFHVEVDEGGWFGVAEFEFRVGTRDGQSLLRRELVSRQPAAAATPEAAVVALSSAVDALIDQLLGACEQQGMFERNPAAVPGN